MSYKSPPKPPEPGRDTTDEETGLTKSVPGDTLGTWLLRARTKHGLTLRELADQAEISKSWLDAVERDVSIPREDVVLRLARLLGEDPFVATRLFEKMRKHRLATGDKRGLPFSVQERVVFGQGQRIRILRLLYTRLLVQVTRASAGTLAREMGLVSRTATKHVELLESEGFVESFADEGSGVVRPTRVYQITMEGIDRVLADGWEPPYHLASPTLLYVADLVRKSGPPAEEGET